MEQSLIRQRYENALQALVGKLKQDPYVLAAVLLGSLSHDIVWERSDIDLLVITQETRCTSPGLCLIEDDISIHAMLMPRSAFKKQLQSAIQSSFIHSCLMKGRLLFTRDATMEELFANRDHFGERDQAIQMLSAASGILPYLVKAEKWLRAKRDIDYSCLWLMKCIDGLASVETLRHGEITGREVIHQALRYNPVFFHRVYTGFLRAEKTETSVTAVLEAVRSYLREHTPLLFGPIFAYLAASDGPRSATEIDHYFSHQMDIGSASFTCEWLADEGMLRRASRPVRITEKSRVDVQEAAYYFDGDEG